MIAASLSKGPKLLLSPLPPAEPFGANNPEPISTWVERSAHGAGQTQVGHPRKCWAFWAGGQLTISVAPIGVLFGCFARKIDGPGLPGGLIIYQGHLLPLKGHLE